MTGTNPQSVRGSRTGVFIGCSASEAHDAWTADGERVTGYEMTGCTRSMFANRLSYFFDFRGLCCYVIMTFFVDTTGASVILCLVSIFSALCIVDRRLVIGFYGQPHYFNRP